MDSAPPRWARCSLAMAPTGSAVADLAEGIRLRQRGISTPVLVYPNSLPSAAADALANSLVPTLVDLSRPEPTPTRRAARATSSSRCVGLERLGVPAEQAVKTIRAMLDMPHLRLAGVCAHPHADPARILRTPTGSSARFTSVVDELEPRASAYPFGSWPPRRSCCASRTRTSTPSIRGGCSTGSSCPARHRLFRSGRRFAR